MSGSEVAGLLLSVIPKIFQGYCVVRELASQYSSFNRTLQAVLRDIETEEGLFRSAVNLLLSEVFNEDTRNIMLANPESEHWHEDGIETVLHSLLADSFRPVMNSIQGVKEALKEIEAILLNLRGEGLTPFKRLTISVAAFATSLSVSTSSLQPQINNIEIQSTRRKVKSIMKDHQNRLKSLRGDLRDHNQSVFRVLQLRSHSSTRKLQRSTSPARNSTRELPREFLNAKATQLASRKLYGLMSKTLLYNCHLLHLRLDYKGEEILASKGKSKESSTTPESKFSFQMTAKPRNCSEQGDPKTMHPSLRLVFTTHDPATAGSAEENDFKSKICEIMLAKDGECKRCIYESGGPNSSFLLQKIPIPKGQSLDSNIATAISLDDLVTSRPKELSNYDCLLIAANLASSVLPFYSSPWIRDWSLRTIQFFETQEKSASSPGLWTPHLSLVFDSRDQGQFGVKNREIYSLGLVLLGLGRNKRLEFSQEEEDIVLRKALYELYVKMGSDYQRFVERCLYEWGNRNEDLMKEDNLSSFLSEINVLQSRSKKFIPKASEVES